MMKIGFIISGTVSVDDVCLWGKPAMINMILIFMLDKRKNVPVNDKLSPQGLLFQELKDYIYKCWHQVSNAPGKFISPFEELVVCDVITFAEEQVNEGNIPIREAISAILAVFACFIECDNWYPCSNQHIGTQIRRHLHAFEYHILTCP